MKIACLVLCLILISCTHIKSSKREVASQSFPARIVKVLSPTQKDFVFEKNMQLEIKVQAYKFGSSVASNRKVSFEPDSNKASFQFQSEYTDANGIATAIVNITDYPASITVKVRVDNVIKNIELNIQKPSTYIGEYSLERSLFTSDKSQVIATTGEEIKFTYQFKNLRGEEVDAYGLDVKLIELSGKHYQMNYQGKGLYSLKIKASDFIGEQKFKVQVGNKYSPSDIRVIFLPDLELVSGSFKAYKVKDKREHEVFFVIRDKKTGMLKSTNGINIVPVVKGDGSFSKITFDTKRARFKFTFYPPKNSGSSKLGVKVNDKEYYLSEPVFYEYQTIDPSKIKLEVEDRKIIPSGFDYLNLKVSYLNAKNEIVNLKNKEQFPSFNVSGEAKIVDFKQLDTGVFTAKLVPGLNQKQLRLELLYENKVIEDQDFNFDFRPISEKVILQRVILSGAYKNDIMYKLDDRQGFKNVTGKVFGFNFKNEGGNETVPLGCASDADSNDCQAAREYEFRFKDQATQNIALLVTDLPIDKLSSMMHSWFYFFPRKVIPHVKFSEDNTQIILTLPTNEKVVFDAVSKQIISGVLEEEVIDLGPSRHTRKFPLLRYKGYGTVLRINARGQDARLGNWNRNKISGDFGNTGAQGVMIYQFDSQTQKQRVCHASKKDFWPQEDINPIPFKYYSDNDFAAYLKSHCSFNLTLD